jgi:hypothetical protein
MKVKNLLRLLRHEDPETLVVIATNDNDYTFKPLEEVGRALWDNWDIGFEWQGFEGRPCVALWPKEVSDEEY